MRCNTERARPIVILAADDGAAERSLGRIVVERDARILDESREARPALEHVERLPQPVIGDASQRNGFDVRAKVECRRSGVTSRR